MMPASWLVEKFLKALKKEHENLLLNKVVFPLCILGAISPFLGSFLPKEVIMATVYFASSCIAIMIGGFMREAFFK